MNELLKPLTSLVYFLFYFLQAEYHLSFSRIQKKNNNYCELCLYNIRVKILYYVTQCLKIRRQTVIFTERRTFWKPR